MPKRQILKTEWNGWTRTDELADHGETQLVRILSNGERLLVVGYLDSTYWLMSFCSTGLHPDVLIPKDTIGRLLPCQADLDETMNACLEYLIERCREEADGPAAGIEARMRWSRRAHAIDEILAETAKNK